LPHRLETAHTILQPQFAPDMTPPAAVNLPEVFFWAPQLRQPQFIMPFRTPGYQDRPTQPRALNMPPKLETPALEPPDVSTQAPLDLPNTPSPRLAAPLPVRSSDEDIRWSSASADSTPGDPTALLSLSLDPSRLREFLSVPPGNQLGQMPETGTSGAISASAAGTGPAGHAASAPSGPAGPDSPGAAGSAGKPGQPGEAMAASAASAADSGALTPAGARAMAIAAAAATRLVHPSGGVFDVVVESSGAEGFPDSAGALSGKPVYTAYVRTGAPKDWLLQYCIPAAEEHAAEVSGAVVRIGASSRLIAPYPLVTFRPAVKPRPGRFVMVHGLITANGHFQDLSILGATELYETEMVLGVLDQWEFRPATQDDRPVNVEILLAIPAE
jgi:hypothetical protein